MKTDGFLRRAVVSMTRLLLLCLVVTSARGDVGAADQQPPPVATAKQSAEVPIVIPMELLANRPLVRVRINRQGPFAFLVAPDARVMLIDQSLASELKLKAQNDRTATSQFELQMEFGTGKLLTVGANATDMAGFVPEFGSAARPRGVISASVWPSHLVTLDYPRYQVAVAPGSLPQPNRRDVFGLNPESPEFGVRVVVGSTAIACRLNPLFPGGLLLSEPYMKSLPLTGKLVDTGSMVTTKGRVLVSEAQVAVDATLGTFEFSKPLVRFADADNSCMIGGQWLVGFSITYDLANARVRLARPRAR